MAEVNNLYLHFPFCRTKCSYCALHSRAGASIEERDEYARRLAEEVRALPSGDFATVYFGGGSPALAELAPVFAALKSRLTPTTEFTVELHPLDVSDDLLERLCDGGVNRISMGVQSLDDATLAHMRRGYDFATAERAFATIRKRFDNAGIDLIVGYPGETNALSPRHARLANWGLRHCSVYSLILEERSILSRRLRDGVVDGRELPNDEVTLDRIAIVARFMRSIGLERYEISNYAQPGFECRHNLAVWRGEDYYGLGEGAHGRVGRMRTPSGEILSPTADATERAIFRLRTREGIDAANHPEWREPLDRFTREGLLIRDGAVYRLTERGTEICDTILTELVP